MHEHGPAAPLPGSNATWRLTTTTVEHPAPLAAGAPPTPRARVVGHHATSSVTAPPHTPRSRRCAEER